jgi:hypothetical protein
VMTGSSGQWAYSSLMQREEAETAGGREGGIGETGVGEACSLAERVLWAERAFLVGYAEFRTRFHNFYPFIK